MNFKKIIAASALAGALFLSLFSCGNQGDDGADNVTGGINFDYSKGLTEDGFFEGVKASDYVSLPQYKGVPVPASVLTASDEELQAQIDGIRNIPSMKRSTTARSAATTPSTSTTSAKSTARSSKAAARTAKALPSP